MKDWAQQNGLDYKTINTQCRRVVYEYENVIQYSSGYNCQLSFRKYIYSYLPPAELARCFMYNYKDPDPRYADLSGRMKKAQEWCNFF